MGLRVLLFAAVLGLLATASFAADRVALVIGNAAYSNATVLPNPVNDAHAISATLQGMGFEVIKGTNLDAQGMQQTLRSFVGAIAEAKVVLFYYAGHGIQVGGKNYLIPVDANLTDQASLDFDTVDADKVFGYMGGEGRIALAFLDACRDNPFTRSLARTIGATRGAIDDGLAAPETTGSGLFIGFATAPNDVAADGYGANSPFTTAMLKHLPTPGLEINQVMTRVKADVRDSTDGGQRPWSNSDLAVDVFLVPAVADINSLGDALMDKIESTAAAYVQLGTQPTAADAEVSAKNTQARLGDLLPRGLEVRRVDLGRKGVWFRVVLPVSSYQDAIAQCAALRLSSIDCIAIDG